MKTVCVIVAARNASTWLSQSLASIAGQQLPSGWRLRILLGIDACASSLGSAHRLCLPGLETFYFPEHVGPFVIFNSLAGRYAADALVRFDADDVMLNGYLHSQLERIPPASQLRILQTWSIYVDERLRPERAHLANGSSTGPDGRRPSASDGQFMMTYAVWERLGAFQAWWCHADSEYMQRACWAGVKRETLPHYLYLRRIHSKSVTKAANTGYNSGMRRYYAQRIADASTRYARGVPVERLPRAVAPHLQCVGYAMRPALATAIRLSAQGGR